VQTERCSRRACAYGRALYADRALLPSGSRRRSSPLCRHCTGRALLPSGSRPRSSPLRSGHFARRPAPAERCSHRAHARGRAPAQSERCSRRVHARGRALWAVYTPARRCAPAVETSARLQARARRAARVHRWATELADNQVASLPTRRPSASCSSLRAAPTQTRPTLPEVHPGRDAELPGDDAGRGASLTPRAAEAGARQLQAPCSLCCSRHTTRSPVSGYAAARRLPCSHRSRSLGTYVTSGAEGPNC